MNTILWVVQALVAAVFLYSGIQKSIYREEKLVAAGQTGVAGLPGGLIRFIGVAELLGTIGIILPMLLHILPILTIVSAAGFSIIMVLAAVVHYKRHEPKNVVTNCILFMLCLFIIYGRLYLTN